MPIDFYQRVFVYNHYIVCYKTAAPSYLGTLWGVSLIRLGVSLIRLCLRQVKGRRLPRLACEVDDRFFCPRGLFFFRHLKGEVVCLHIILCPSVDLLQSVFLTRKHFHNRHEPKLFIVGVKGLPVSCHCCFCHCCYVYFEVVYVCLTVCE